MNVAFVEPVTHEAIYEIGQLPGVIHCEPYRAIATKMRLGPRERRVGVMGLLPQSELFRLMNVKEERVDVPPAGLMLSSKLAELLDAEIDDTVMVEVLEGERLIRELPVTAMVTEFGGTNAYMNATALWTVMREDRALTGAFLDVDGNQADALYRTLKDTPRVASVAVKKATLQSFRETIAENLLAMRTFNIMFACIIAFGVVYNNARISLSERSRELATLRVIGFTRGEISGILLGELGTLTIPWYPPGNGFWDTFSRCV